MRRHAGVIATGAGRAVDAGVHWRGRCGKTRLAVVKTEATARVPSQHL
jgi:hypothetical protein